MDASGLKSPSKRRQVERGRREAILAGETEAIRGRLAGAVNPNWSGPVLGRSRPVLELAGQSRGTAHGGIAVIARVVDRAGLAGEIDGRMWLPERPLTARISSLIMCSTWCLTRYAAVRACKTSTYAEATGRSWTASACSSLPDPSTARDFSRRFDTGDVMALQEAISAAGPGWETQPASFFGGDDGFAFPSCAHPANPGRYARCNRSRPG